MVADGLVGETVDREGLLSVVSPVVLPPSVVAALVDEPALDLADAGRVAAPTSHRVVLVEAPAAARRVSLAEDDLRCSRRSPHG